MKTKTKTLAFLAIIIAGIMLNACQSPVTLTSWKNPDDHTVIAKVAIFPLFNKLEYTKPFEQSVITYFQTQGLKAIGSLDFLNPTVNYSMDQVIKKIDSLGADGVLVFAYKGTDTSKSYVPPTYTGGWGAGYWGGPYWSGGFYGGGYWDSGVVTGGYWVTTSTVNLKASLYVKDSHEAVWTGDITVTDPNYVDKAATTIAQDIYNDWVKDNIVASPTH
ncbi:MAG: hypothetical protein KKA81_04560 [Bacteroidetes bacterium]|nr:hypothetical protein [Bacteroidota bacterium]